MRILNYSLPFSNPFSFLPVTLFSPDADSSLPRTRAGTRATARDRTGSLRLFRRNENENQNDSPKQKKRGGVVGTHHTPGSSAAYGVPLNANREDGMEAGSHSALSSTSSSSSSSSSSSPSASSSSLGSDSDSDLYTDSDSQTDGSIDVISDTRSRSRTARVRAGRTRFSRFQTESSFFPIPRISIFTEDVSDLRFVSAVVDSLDQGKSIGEDATTRMGRLPFPVSSMHTSSFVPRPTAKTRSQLGGKLTYGLPSIARNLSRHLRFNLKNALRRMYDLGSIFVVLSMVVAVGLLIWQAHGTARALWEATGIEGNSASPAKASDHVAITSTSSVHVKRSMSPHPGATTEPHPDHSPQTTRPLHSSMVIQPLIPGITVPFSHLFPLLAALLLCQIFHELGHIVSAALVSVIPTRISLNLHLVIPSAHVAFPSSISDLAAKTRLQMAASGPFHNLGCWAVLTLLMSSPIKSLFVKDFGSSGLVITDVLAGSPLKDRLIPGYIVTSLNGYKLAGNESLWDNYLLGTKSSGDLTIWCVDRRHFRQALLAPCQSSSTDIAFSAVASDDEEENPKDYRCLAAHSVLNEPPISPSIGCKLDQIQVSPASNEQLLRIGYRTDEADVDAERALVWSGDRRIIWHDLIVSQFDFRRPKDLGLLFRFVYLILAYSTILSASLALLNVLPLPLLDGSHILQALLDLYDDKQELSTEYRNYPIGEMDFTNARGRWNRRVIDTVQGATITLVIFSLGGNIILAFL